MVLVAGLDRLKGTRVGPWLTDAEWQDHTREVRERYEARSDTSVAFQDFCRAYAEGRLTTAAMRRARAPKGRDAAPSALHGDNKGQRWKHIHIRRPEGGQPLGRKVCEDQGAHAGRAALHYRSRRRHRRAPTGPNSIPPRRRPPPFKTSMAPS